MLKKFLIILSLFCLVLFTSSACFAMNLVEGAKNVMEDAGNGMKTMVNDAANSMEGAKNGVSDMMNDMGEGMHDTVDRTESDMTDDNTTGMTETDNGGYSAERTSTRAISTDTTSATASTSTAFVWIVLAIAAVLIVGLVWYYGTQTENRNNE